MFTHVMVGTNDIDRAKDFYDALFVSIGGKAGRFDPRGRVVYLHKGAAFLISTPIDGQPACHANGGTIGIGCDTPGAVDAWHLAGLEAGGVAIEDPPGLRQTTFGPAYIAYLRDPDGNKLCCVHRLPE